MNLLNIEDRFLRQPEVLELVGFSARTLWRLCQNGNFPSPVKISKRVTAWRAVDVSQWIRSQK
jgi:prophage regulatory protein